MTSWLRDAIFYQIYPQSFCDSNGDGIGDFRGIEQKLSYLQELGVNAIWMNPCFDSSFFDAGYDVRNYYSVAPRYGTNEDLKHLCEAVHERGMHLFVNRSVYLARGRPAVAILSGDCRLPERNLGTPRNGGIQLFLNAARPELRLRQGY